MAIQTRFSYSNVVKTVFCLTLLILSSGAFSKTTSSDAVGLKQAKNQFKRGQYSGLGKRLIPIIKRTRNSSIAEESIILLIEGYIRQAKYQKASKAITNFITRFPSSSHASRILYYQAVVQISKTNYYNGAMLLSKCLNRNQSPLLYQRSGLLLNELVDQGKLEEELLSNIAEKLTRNGDYTSHVLLKLAEVQSANGRYRAAASTYSQWLNRFQKHPDYKHIFAKYKQIKKQRQNHLTILIMVPTTGVYHDVGKSLLEGVLLSLASLTKEGSAYKYKIIDTEGDPLIAINRLRKTLRSENVLAIIGPVMSDVSTAVAIELSSRGTSVPMITPTATTAGISALGPGIFQLNMTTETLGWVIGEYAIKCLDIHEFAILAPNTEYGVGLAEAFGKVVGKLGGIVVATEYYDPNSKDYGGHFQVIRYRKAKKDMQKQLIIQNSPNKTIDETELESRVKDSVLHLPGLFIAASNGDEAIKLASQARYNKLKTNIFGSSGWNDNSLLHSGLRKLNEVVFSVNYLKNQNSEKWGLFERQYKKRWKIKPNNVAVLGYDAGNFLRMGLSQASANNQSVISQLRAIKQFKGLRGNINMHPLGYNQSANLARISKRKFEKVELCTDMVE